MKKILIDTLTVMPFLFLFGFVQGSLFSWLPPGRLEALLYPILLRLLDFWWLFPLVAILYGGAELLAERWRKK